jgi:hypothetical protein
MSKSLYNDNEGTYISDKPDWISYYPISDKEIINYGARDCDTNAFKLAIKFKKLKPQILIGYRTITMPCEYLNEQPHFAVLVKDKVWEIAVCFERGLRYSVSNIEEWSEYHGFKNVKNTEMLKLANQSHFWPYYLNQYQFYKRLP